MRCGGGFSFGLSSQPMKSDQARRNCERRLCGSSGEALFTADDDDDGVSRDGVLLSDDDDDKS